MKIIQNYLLTKISVLSGSEISSYTRKCLLSGGIEKTQNYAATEVYALTYTSVGTNSNWDNKAFYRSCYQCFDYFID